MGFGVCRVGFRVEGLGLWALVILKLSSSRKSQIMPDPLELLRDSGFRV